MDIAPKVREDVNVSEVNLREYPLRGAADYD